MLLILANFHDRWMTTSVLKQRTSKLQSITMCYAILHSKNYDNKKSYIFSQQEMLSLEHASTARMSLLQGTMRLL